MNEQERETLREKYNNNHNKWNEMCVVLFEFCMAFVIVTSVSLVSDCYSMRSSPPRIPNSVAKKNV